MKHEKILSIDLHAFGDASRKGVAATVYMVVEEQSGMNQGLVTVKSQLSNKGLTLSPVWNWYLDTWLQT